MTRLWKNVLPPQFFFYNIPGRSLKKDEKREGKLKGGCKEGMFNIDTGAIFIKGGNKGGIESVDFLNVFMKDGLNKDGA